ncbi:ATP-binding protein [Lichenihabitans sp. Uapishka_5]|uniref:ATP-binding protein n=1 Tax=Lichenihabitans sp. Uapishka_5 TaxID=3037302 RepID=UPI0029E811AE|nr:ATP-binding protein [Lichenihabitans sp. Uapishka_5]MDX7950705.1 ATP-binding protein [Lichenihabitans sp. Uapishka_5]
MSRLLLRDLWRGWTSAKRRFADWMPKRLYSRALLIVVIPVVLLQCVIAYFFMERHWQAVTYRLSVALTQDIAALVDLHRSLPADGTDDTLERIAFERLGLDVDVLPKQPLPPPLPKPFFSLLDNSLSAEIRKQIGLPFWIDTVGRSSMIEIRIQMDDAVLRVMARRSAAYASNSHIFLLWMLATSIVLLTIAIAFLRNQIKPILRLAAAAENLGKGRMVEFRPSGALEVRRAGYAFLEMKRRLERSMEQRTTMLNGVSHDLRTILTRFKLSLALIGQGPDTADMEADVAEMNRMLGAYLAFARGDAGESSTMVDIAALLEDLRQDAGRHGRSVQLEILGESAVAVRPDAFKRCLANLVGNAQRYGGRVAMRAVRDARFLTIHVDDDGPGIPLDKRDDVFRPFFRLDEARNQDAGGTGLGLAIARDIARSHGGDIQLGESPLGGLRASVRVPV